MTVAIVTDSSACIPRDLAERHRIAVVPIQVSIDDESFRSTEIARDRLLAALGESGRKVATAGPTPGDFLDVVEAHDRGDGVLVVTLAASMSATHRSATLAASQAMVDVEVLDSGTAVGGHALVALEAARAAERGADLSEVRRVAEDVAEAVRLVAAVGSLDALARSGRVPVAASKAGDALGVRPLFEFRAGEPHVLMPSLDEHRAYQRLVDRCLDQRPDGGARLHASVLHADRAAAADEVCELLGARTDPAEMFVSRFDAAMMVHSGTDVVGIAWWWEPPS